MRPTYTQYSKKQKILEVDTTLLLNWAIYFGANSEDFSQFQSILKICTDRFRPPD